MKDLISRQDAIDALWKALYEYEDKTEKQFQESDELDVGDWILHRGFVQNMSDIDRQTIQSLPSVDAVEVVRCRDCKHRFLEIIQGEKVFSCLYRMGTLDLNGYCDCGAKMKVVTE